MTSFGTEHTIIVNGLTAGYFAAPLSMWALVFQFIGAIVIFFCYAPGSFQTIRNKQTYGLSFTMWIITIVALTSLAIFAWCGLGNTIHAPGQFIVVAISETGSLVFSLIIFTIKLMNMRKAKKMGMSEEEYCKSLISNTKKA